MQTKTLNSLPATALVIEGVENDALNLNFAAPFEEQVKKYFVDLGNAAHGVTHVVISGKAEAACLMLPALEMLGGLPAIALVPFGQKTVSAWVGSANFRHNTVRSRRGELRQGEIFPGFTVLDGSGRGLTPVQHTELSEILGVCPELIRVINIQVGNRGQVDLLSAETATAGMADVLVNTQLTAGDWVSGRIVFLPGGAGIVGALQAVSIHGISEAWPKVIRLNADSNKVFHVAEVIDPQAMRQWAVGLTVQLNAAKPTATLLGSVPEEFRAALIELAKNHGVRVRG